MLNVPYTLGGILIFVGLALTWAEFLRAKGTQRHQAHHGIGQMRGFDASVGKAKFKLTTTYAGIIIIALGVLLVGIGAFAH